MKTQEMYPYGYWIKPNGEIITVNEEEGHELYVPNTSTSKSVLMSDKWIRITLGVYGEISLAIEIDKGNTDPNINPLYNIVRTLPPIQRVYVEFSDRSDYWIEHGGIWLHQDFKGKFCVRNAIKWIKQH